MINFGNNLEEFFKDFKERVVEGAYYSYPKDYCKSDAYLNKDLDEKFDEALRSYMIKDVLLGVVESYYETLKEYEDILGY